ncbi:hypothetical protein IEQ34_005266 [Dendrobium chrysotoxum]|uniref:Pentatricopeptide repeat-containing protein n=1 Tax=Dendrobium chrysotoxum TaxID=161865 RepID=A0AAV7HB05_DENCH|nr:hypothetical protein IEQ34_005266 [Dendrobium chrysotoxum]
MLSQAIEPDAATYGFIVDGYFRDGRIENAMVFVHKLVSSGEAALKADVKICNEMVDELVKAGCVGQAMKVFRKIGVSSTRANAATYQVLMTSLFKVGDFDGARALLEEMVNCGILVSIELQSFVSESFKKAGRSAEVELLLASSAAASPQELSSTLVGLDSIEKGGGRRWWPAVARGGGRWWRSKVVVDSGRGGCRWWRRWWPANGGGRQGVNAL